MRRFLAASGRFVLVVAAFVVATVPVLLVALFLTDSIDLTILIFTAVPAVLFTLAYGAFFPWWKDQAGQQLLLFTGVLSLLLLRSVLLRAGAADANPASWYLRGLVYVIGLLLWHRFWLLVQSQWRPAIPPRRREGD